MFLIGKEITIHSLICYLGRYLVGNKKSPNITTQDLKTLQSRLNKLDICQPDKGI